jgi:hypothetical protein
MGVVKKPIIDEGLFSASELGIIASAFYFHKVLHDPQLQAQFADLLYRTYGITFEEFIERLGISYTAAP